MGVRYEEWFSEEPNVKILGEAAGHGMPGTAR